MADDAEQARSRFVEQFAVLLNDGGLQRMPARVFAYVLASDAETHTAADLAEGLRVSPAAISGAVRLLVDLAILVKDRSPGERMDHYRLYSEDVLATIMSRQEPMFRHIDAMFAHGLGALEPGRGRRRVQETRAFYGFLHAELDHLASRWDERKTVRSEPAPVRAVRGE